MKLNLSTIYAVAQLLVPIALYLLLNLLPFFLSGYPNLTLYRGPIFWAADQLQKILLQPLQLILDQAAFEALDSQPTAEQDDARETVKKESIRKVESVFAILKAILKLPQIIGTMVLIFLELKINAVSAVCTALVALLVMGMIWWTLLYPYSLDTDAKKKKRDDALPSGTDD
ncbi:hypothetical protein ColTof4_01326 [Colletotrichum tofieldiae]|nr:hypothetical protein ColTof4_01326 [Colletotrichum tofieldiae]